MRIRTRLQRLERRLAKAPTDDDSTPVEIDLPDNRRGGLPPGRYPCGGSKVVLVIVEPSPAPSVRQEQP
jgi:hypothetical protein